MSITIREDKHTFTLVEGKVPVNTTGDIKGTIAYISTEFAVVLCSKVILADTASLLSLYLTT